MQPVSPEPCVTQDSVRFSHLVVDLVQAKDTLYHVLYIGTGEPCLDLTVLQMEKWLRLGREEDVSTHGFKAAFSAISPSPRVRYHPESAVHGQPQPAWLLPGGASCAAPRAP